jgi:hypothetical protein
MRRARTNIHYRNRHVYPTLEHVALKDITKFQVQMLLNHSTAWLRKNTLARLFAMCAI